MSGGMMTGARSWTWPSVSWAVVVSVSAHKVLTAFLTLGDVWKLLAPRAQRLRFIEDAVHASASEDLHGGVIQ
jgi:hypothetical protein